MAFNIYMGLLLISFLFVSFMNVKFVKSHLQLLIHLLASLGSLWLGTVLPEWALWLSNVAIVINLAISVTFIKSVVRYNKSALTLN